ncbi:MAG: hypothetical protein U9Q03_00075 [Patescibacteria group bacterium]|nr:hypothetical protein [Patescibacteria group bacterium]
MEKYSEPVHWLGIMHRGIMVDIYRRLKGVECCGIDYDFDEPICHSCGKELDPVDVYHVCISGIFIPGLESTDDTEVAELARANIDDAIKRQAGPLGHLYDPEVHGMAQFEIETYSDDAWDEDGEGDEEEWAEPLPGSLGDRFNQVLSSGDPNGGRSDLLDPVRENDRITEEPVGDALAKAEVGIVPTRPPVQAGQIPLQDGFRKTLHRRHAKELGWGKKGLKIIKDARGKK